MYPIFSYDLLYLMLMNLLTISISPKSNPHCIEKPQFCARVPSIDVSHQTPSHFGLSKALKTFFPSRLSPCLFSSPFFHFLLSYSLLTLFLSVGLCF